MRGKAQGNLTCTRPRAGFPRGTEFLGGNNKRANCFPPTSRFDPPQALLPSRSEPAEIFRKRVHGNSFPPSHPATGPAPHSFSPTSAPGPSQPPPGLSSWYPQPRVPSPGRATRGFPRRPRSALRRSPAKAHRPSRHRPQLQGGSSPSASGQGHGVLVPEHGQPAFRTLGWEERGPLAGRRASIQLSPLTCSSGVDF